MPVPTKPNEQRLRRDSDFNWEQFAKDCLLNKYVLVVSNEAVLNRNVNSEAEGDSLKLLLGLAIQELAQSNTMLDNRLDICTNFNDLFKLHYSKDSIKEAVLDAIDNNLFITLYGSSGIGKTSLLRAGVIPILRRKDYFPLYVRLSQEPAEISYAEAIVRKLQSRA